MARDTLLDVFEDFSGLHDVFIVHDDGYRTRELTYAELAARARAFAVRLAAAGVNPDDTVVVWSENRPEWVAVLWGTWLAGAVLVPVDYRASPELLARISRVVDARVVIVGDETADLTGVTGAVWLMRDLAGASAAGPGASPPRPAGLAGASLAEIIFTSGATAEPKGVTLTHRNILANLIPIEREIAKYRRLERPFHPLRFLNLLPMSHMFGQSMATFIPPMIGGTVVFSHSYSPADVIRQIRSRRVSVLVCVPKVLAMLREHLERQRPETTGPDPLAGHHWTRRWWHYRRAHRLFGWKFWCVVCGAAPLDPDLEAYWRKLGFLVVQGYGLTETAPIVTLNHPMRASRGTVGTPIGGVEVRIADDGEILVRGENVTGGYYQPGHGTAPASPLAADGWFHTGDIGALDDAGRLLIKGRKKEMIVTAQGLNVFPEDVERALLARDGVTDAAVVGVQAGSEEHVHAVLVLTPGTSADAVVEAANAALEDHQRVRGYSIWPGEALPRTEGTQKLRRVELRRWVAGEPAATRPHGAATSVIDIVHRFAGDRSLTPETTLEAVGLSSLDRVELMMALEEAFQTTLDESMLTSDRTIGDLERLVRPMAAPEDRPGHDAIAGPPTSAPPIRFPAWNRSWIARGVRRASLPTWILPPLRGVVDLRVDGLAHLDGLDTPVLFAANHQSHLDTPVVLMALPPRWRYRLAPAMAKEFFAAHFNPGSTPWKARAVNSLAYYLACEFFAAFPLPQREAGTRQTLRYVGEQIGDGYSILIFPEGRRQAGHEIGTFLPGVGMMAARLDTPVVPVRIRGLDAVFPAGARRPRRGPVSVSFGAPLTLAGTDYGVLAKRVEDAVRDA